MDFGDLTAKHPDRVAYRDPVKPRSALSTNTASTGHPFCSGWACLRAAGRNRTGGLHRGRVALYLLSYNRMRASGGIRTLNLSRTGRALHLVSFEGMGTASGTRTEDAEVEPA